jgi:hypothetical protein
LSHTLVMRWFAKDWWILQVQHKTSTCTSKQNKTLTQYHSIEKQKKDGGGSCHVFKEETSRKWGVGVEIRGGRG